MTLHSNNMEVVELPQPHLLDEGGFLQGLIPFGWRARLYHCVKRWLDVILPVSLLFLLLYWLRPERRKRYAVGAAVLPPAEKFDAVCSETDGSLVYLQVKDDIFAQFQALCKHMNEYYSSEGEVADDVEPGDYCAVQTAGGADWKRARVVGRLNGVLKVYFVDTGDTQEVEDSQSKELTAEFSILPAMAVKCQLEESVDGVSIVAVRRKLRVVVSDRQTDPPMVCIKRMRSLHMSPSPSGEPSTDVYRLHEIRQGKYFVRGRKLCHVSLEWTEEREAGKREREEGGCSVVAVVGDFTAGKQVPLERESDRVFRRNCCLPIGEYEFSFVVDGRKTYNPTLPTKTTSSGEVVNYLSIESLASVSELRLTVDATKGQHPAYVIAEDEPIGDDTRVVQDEGVSTLHVDFDWEQQVEVGNNSNEGQITTAWDSDTLNITLKWEDIDPKTLPTPVVDGTPWRFDN